MRIFSMWRWRARQRIEELEVEVLVRKNLLNIAQKRARCDRLRFLAYARTTQDALSILVSDLARQITEVTKETKK